MKVLNRPFPVNEHRFLDGKAYLKEHVITARLDEVDPAWSFEIQRIDISGQNVVVVARLTVKGVAREGVGMQKILEKAGEAEKGAASDALKRCARLFGVGRYLVGAPKTEAEFKSWMAGGNQQQQATRQTPQRRTVTSENDLDTNIDAMLGTTDPLTDASQRFIDVTSVAVLKSSAGKNYLRFGPERQAVTTFTREALRAAGLDAAIIDLLTKPGDYTLPPVRVYWEPEGMQRRVKRIERLSLGEKVVA